MVGILEKNNYDCINLFYQRPNYFLSNF